MFNQITRMIKSKTEHCFVKVSLPAIEHLDADENISTRVDPNLSVDDIVDVLKANWSEDYIKKMMLTRFIAVICDNSIRTKLAEFVQANDNASQADLNEAMQAYVDSGWNVDLKHPATDRSMKSVEKRQAKSEQWMSEMSTDAQKAFIDKLTKNNPELAQMLNPKKK